MNIQRFFLLFYILVALPCLVVAQSTMTDEQIMTFIAKEKANNTSRSLIVSKLIERGVDIQRIRKKYEKQKKNELNVIKNSSKIEGTEGRLRHNNALYEPQRKNKNFTQRDSKSIEDDSHDRLYLKYLNSRQQNLTTDREVDFIMSDSLQQKKDNENDFRVEINQPKTKKVFGRDIFINTNLTFEPELNISTPADYRLGAGDAVFVDVWGASQKQYTSTVSPEGELNIEGFGPIYVSGMTVAQANTAVRTKLGQRFGGSNIKLTIGQTKSITVNVMGEVTAPGTITLPAFSTVFHALYTVGGTNEIGTMRAIKVYRNNRLISTIDLYDYILNGNLRGNVRLASNDVIIVEPYKCLVNITGKVKRPMFYEMRSNESVSTLIKFAGGFTGDAYEENVRLIRKKGGQMSIYTLNEFERGTFQLADADSVTVDSVLDRYKNMVDLRGAVMRPGKYQMDGNISTLRQLIAAAGGLAEEAITTRGLLHRRKEDRTLKAESFNTGAILGHTEADITLRNEDIIFIPSRKDLNETLSLTIEGEVQYPGTYEYAENLTIEDFILKAGGLTDKSSIAKVDVSRRLRDHTALTSGEQIAEVYSFSIKDGFVLDGKPGFLLLPFDEVFVRTSPGYVEQQHATIEGEVNFSGKYALTKKNARLSDLVKQAGGCTPEAYLSGARLIRQLLPHEIQKYQQIHKIVTLDDSTELRKIPVEKERTIAINLDKACAHPGNDKWDIILRDGDQVFIPRLNNTVSISGEVMYPNTVAYKPNAALSYYVNQSGGYRERARKSRAFVINPNGTVTRVRSAKDIKPGSSIVIPTRPKRNWGALGQLISLSMSLVTLAAVLANTFKK